MSEHRSERVIEGGARPEWGRLPVAAVVIVGSLLAAIVGMASADSPWLPGDGGDTSQPAIVGQVLAVGLGAGLCALLGLIWVNSSRRAKARRPGFTTEGLGSGLRTGSFVLIGGMLVVIALVVAFRFLLEQANVAQLPPVATTGDAGAPPLPGRPHSASSASPVFDWFLFGLIVSLAVVAPVALIARRRGWVTEEAQPEDSEVPQSVVRAVGESIDQIERDPDARRAIIRAYAQMEHAFDDAGIPRRPHEAPFEYLGRALRVCG